MINNLTSTIEELENEPKKKLKKKKKNSKQSHQNHNRIKNKEQQELKISEIKLKSKQKIQHLKDNLESEIDNAKASSKLSKIWLKKFDVKSIISEDEYLKLTEYDATDHFRVGMGAEAILELIKQIDVEELAAQLREESKTVTGVKRVKATKRLRVVEGMKNAMLIPAGLILKVLPVIPPDLTSHGPISGGRFASSDLRSLPPRHQPQ